MSSNNSSGESGKERNTVDLAKGVLKPGETMKTLVSAQAQVAGGLVRGVSAVGHARVVSSGMQTVTSVPVPAAPLKQTTASVADGQTAGVASVVVMSVPRAGLAAAAPSIATSLGQTNASVARPAPTASPATATTTYHVPRGAAAVANIAAPRPGSTALGRTTPGTTAITHASNLVTGLRGLVPRAASPATSTTTWLGTVSQAATSAGVVRPRAPGVASVASYVQPRNPTLTVNTRPMTGPQTVRMQAASDGIRSQNLLPSGQKQMSAQGVTGGTAASQPMQQQQARAQLITGPAASASGPVVGTRVLATSGPAGSAPATVSVSVSAVPAIRPTQAAVLTAGPRPAGPGSVRPTTSSIRPVTASTATATLALAVGTQVRPRLTAAGPGRITAAGPTPRLLTTPVRPSPTPVSTATATMLPAQSRLGVAGPAASVVSLHSVVVSSGTGLPLKSGAARPNLSPKVISQPGHAAPSIQITQVPVSMQSGGKLPPTLPTALPQAPVTRTVAYTANVASSTTGVVVTGAGSGPMRPVSVTTSTLASPVTKVTLHATAAPGMSGQPGPQQLAQAQTQLQPQQLPPQPQQQQTQQPQQQLPQQASVCIQHRASPAPSAVEHPGPVLSTYNIPAYVYEAGPGTGASGAYQVTGVVARPYPTGGTATSGAPTTTYTVQTSAAAVLRPSGVVATSAPVKFNPVVVVDPSRSALPVHSSYLQEGALTTSGQEAAPPPPPPPAVSKPSASPRPSILRKRDNEGSPLKAQKNLTPVLSSLTGPSPSNSAVVVSTTTSSSSSSISTVTSTGPPVSPPSPCRPDSRGGAGGGGNSSGGSTTISATSSPGLGEAGEENSSSAITVKQEPIDETSDRPPLEMSPRKKPRKQQLTGNELHEPKFSEDEMEFISEERIKKEVKEGPTIITTLQAAPAREEPVEKPAVLPPTRRPGLTLLSSYRHSWKSRHNHYMRYSDVRPKDERRPTVSELAAQKQVLQKLEGWKVHHLSTQMEELSELEQQVTERLAGLLKLMEKRMGKELDKDINRINELIKGNMQRSKVTCDQMQEAKVQVMKVFEHKGHVADIINRCGNKRSIKKREKS